MPPLKPEAPKSDRPRYQCHHPLPRSGRSQTIQFGNQLIEQYLSLKAPGYITLLTLVEITWVLESCYKQPSDAIRAVLRKMLSTKVLVVQQADIATRALERYEKHGGDFSDAVMAVTGETSGCTTTLTFDKGAIRHGMILLEQSSLAKL